MKAYDEVHRWLFEPVENRGIFLTRVVFGLILVTAYLDCLPHVQSLFGPGGIGGYDTLARHPGFVGVGIRRFGAFGVLDAVDSPAVVWGLYAALLAFSAGIALGFRIRWLGLVGLLLHAVFVARLPELRGGWVGMLVPYLAYVIIANPSDALSVDARRGAHAPEARRFVVVPVGLRLLQVHIATMYLVAGWERLDHDAWLRGEMVLRAVASAEHGRFLLDWFALRPVLSGFTWFAFVLEPAAPLLLFVPRISKWCAVLLIAMHLGILLTTRVGYWQIMMIGGLLTFLPNEWLRWLPSHASRAQRG